MALLKSRIAEALEERSLVCHEPLPPSLLPANLEADRQQQLDGLYSQIAVLEQACFILIPWNNSLWSLWVEADKV